MDSSTIQQLKSLLARDMDIESYVMNEAFVQRLREDRTIFHGITVHDFDSVIKHIRLLEGYAQYITDCIAANKMPAPLAVFRQDTIYHYKPEQPRDLEGYISWIIERVNSTQPAPDATGE
jgi:hypothetical protein